MSYGGSYNGGYNGGYGDYPQHQYSYPDASNNGPYPPHAATQNPFASSSQVDLHTPTYPPGSGQNPRDSTWSMDEEPLKAGGAAGGYSGVQRGRDNPYAAEYKPKSSWRRWWIPILLGLLVIAGVVIGIVVWKVRSNDSSSSGSGGSGKRQYIEGTAKVVKSNPNDPSDFEKDPRLKPVFYGMAYTPKNVLEEYGCGATLANVTEDIQLLSQLTTRIRTYATACNQTQLVLQAIQDTKVNMTVYLGAYLGPNTTVNADQQEYLLDALKIYGADHVGGCTIGNEYILGAPDRSDTAANAITYVKEQIANFNQSLLALNLGKHIPVGTSDAGSEYKADLATGVDYFMANVHPWFGGVPIDEAAGWTWDFFEQNDVVISEAAPNKPQTYIAETGWPTGSMTTADATLDAAVAGVKQLQTFLDTYPCQANKNESYYFYFEPFDEPWKERYGGVEPYWGLFSSDKVLKDVTLPSCDVDSSHSSG
ncbi:hypothetical protein JCM11251_006095 [Rhodosporidiobolus azoricus]